MKTTQKNTKGHINSSMEVADFIWDTFKNGKLESRTIDKGNYSFSMRYDAETGTFYGSVTNKTEKSYSYNCTEEVSQHWAKMPYPELSDLRDLLIKEWAEDIKAKLMVADFDNYSHTAN